MSRKFLSEAKILGIFSIEVAPYIIHTCKRMFVMITMKGKTKFASSHISTGFIEFVLGKEVDVDK